MKASWKAFLVTLIVLAFLGLGWLRYKNFLTKGQSPPGAIKVLDQLEEKGIPDLHFKDIYQNPLSIKDFKGKVLIINFWASWCEPCVQEFPSMLDLIHKMSGKVQILAISADYNKEDLLLFLKAFKAENNPYFHVVWDKDQKIAKQFGTTALPESYILDRQGKLIKKVSGAENWSSPDAISYFERLSQ